VFDRCLPALYVKKNLLSENAGIRIILAFYDTLSGM
jgi:hypothetical protein